jgi:hypothetical protein
VSAVPGSKFFGKGVAEVTCRLLLPLRRVLATVSNGTAYILNVSACLAFDTIQPVNWWAGPPGAFRAAATCRPATTATSRY